MKRWDVAAVFSCALIFIFQEAVHSQVEYQEPGTPPRRVGPGAGGRGARLLRPERIQEAVERFRGDYGPDAEAIFLPGSRAPSALVGFSFGHGPSSSTDARASTVFDFLEAEGELLDILGSPDPRASLSLSRTHSVAGLTVLRFEQRREGIPVLGGSAIAHIDALGKMRTLLLNLDRDVRLQGTASVSEDAAIRVALKKVGEDPARPDLAYPLSRQVIIKVGVRHLLVWDLKVRSRSGPQRVLVDAVTGEALGSASLLRSADCAPRPKGTGYPESPAKGQPISLELPDLACTSTVLDGQFIRTFNWVATDPFTYDPIFEYGLSGSLVNNQVTFLAHSLEELAQVTIFYHATRFHGWFQDLGFRDLDRPFPTVANALDCFGSFPCENAYYLPTFEYSTGFGILVFGVGMANYGLEADVICHEYTHGVVAATADLGADFFDPDVFYSLALNEAFADYFSSSYVGDPILGEYVGRATGQGFLRTLDNDFRWPRDIDPVHYHNTGQIWGGALWEIRQAFSQDGVDPAGVFDTDRLSFATLVSLQPQSDFLAASAALVGAANALGLSAAQLQTAKEILVRRGLLASGGEPPLAIERVAAGEELAGEVAAVSSGDHRLGAIQYEIVVPEHGSRLVVDLTGTGNVDLYLRHDSPVEEGVGGTIVATARSEGPGGVETIDLVRDGAPALTGGSWFIAVVNRADAVTGYTLKTALELTSFESIVPLPLDQDQAGSVPGGAALGPVQHAFEVTGAAGKRLAVTLSGSQDCNLYLRFGRPVELGLEGQIVADLVAASPSSSEAMGLDEASIPALQAGTYYLAIGNATEDASPYSVRASLSDVAPPSPGMEPLLPGETKSGTAPGALPATARLSDLQFAVTVPEDGARLSLELSSAANLGLYLRHDERVGFEGGRLEFDHSSDLQGTGNETAVASLLSTPRLEPGTYYVAVVNHSSDTAGFTLKATLETARTQATIVDLAEGQWTEVRVRGTGGDPAPVLHGTQFRLRVGAQSPGLDVLTDPNSAGDVDLYIRRDRPVLRLLDGVVADFRAETSRAAESIAVFKEDLPPGDYYVALGTRSPTETVLGLIAVFSGDFSISVPVEEGDLFEGVLNPASAGSCLLSLNQFAVRIPATATRLEIDVTPLDGGPLNVLARHGGRVLIDQGDVVFDDEYREVSGPIVYTDLRLKSGTYFFAVVNCSTRSQRYTVAARVRIPGSPEAVLVPGVFSETSIGTPDPGQSGRLGATQYKIGIGPEIKELLVTAWGGPCAEEDVDLLVALGERVTWGPDEATNADWVVSRRGAGAETLILHADSSPPIAEGTYYVALVSRGRQAIECHVGADFLHVESVLLQNGVTLSDTIATAGEPGMGLLPEKQYRIEVPPTAIDLKASLVPRGAQSQDIDLQARFGLEVFIDGNGRPVADRSSETVNSGIESVAFPSADDCLRPGTYFFAVVNFAPSSVLFDLEATVTVVDASFRRGDANDDGMVNLTDAIVMLGFLFRGGSMNDCMDGADVNDDVEVNITDAIVLLRHLFLGSPAPPEPFVACGGDPTPDGLECASFSNCP